MWGIDGVGRCGCGALMEWGVRVWGIDGVGGCGCGALMEWGGAGVGH